MSIVDIILLVVLAFGALIGFKRGFTKELVSFIGFILAVVLAFYLKDTVSVWFYGHLPFFKFGGILKGVTALNIFVYEVLAFLVVLSILMILQKILLFATGIIERIFDFTIILGIVSKLLGAVVGVIENFVIVFIALYVLTLPVFNMNILRDSKYGKMILEKTPFLSGVVDKSVKVIEEFTDLKEKYQTSGSAAQFNYDTLDLFLKYNVISVENTEMLIEKDKLKIDRVEKLLEKYRKGEE